MMANYVDGYVLAVAKKNLDAYRKIGELAGKIWRDNGALEYYECVGDDLNPKWASLRFSTAAKAKPGDAVIFSWITFKSRAHRDSVNAKVMADSRLKNFDPAGIVESFQMNDRCAAGCGRYLGYIADEMNMGVHQLGPMAMLSSKPAKINSTCTVFAGAELRERLALGEKREDILAGLHRSIILRAMSLLARSGGIESEFTFTGGVARNEAAVSALKELVKENYGEMKMNISPDSIFTGALGGSLYAKRDMIH
jgi:uncharacterized protein YbaA (DUF1428 family)